MRNGIVLTATVIWIAAAVALTAAAARYLPDKDKAAVATAAKEASPFLPAPFDTLVPALLAGLVGGNAPAVARIVKRGMKP